MSQAMKFGLVVLLSQIAVGCVALPGSKMAEPIGGVKDPQLLVSGTEKTVPKVEDGKLKFIEKKTIAVIRPGMKRSDVHEIFKGVEMTKIWRDLGTAEIYEFASDGKILWLVPEPQNAKPGIVDKPVDNMLWVEYDPRGVVTSCELDQTYDHLHHVIAPPWPAMPPDTHD